MIQFLYGMGFGALLVGLLYFLYTELGNEKIDKTKEEKYPNRKLREINRDLKTVKNNIKNKDLLKILDDTSDNIILAIAILEDEERENYDKKV